MDHRPLDLLGVVHLLPLPGAPRSGPGLDQVRARAIADARAMQAGGLRGLIVENLGDAPFEAGTVPPHVVAAMTDIAAAVRDAVGGRLRIGINVLRNDPRAALAVATTVGAELVRVNVHTGAAWTDQGLIQGQAPDTLRYRRLLDAVPSGVVPRGAWATRGCGGVAIAADVHVKHATPAGRESIEVAARDLALRGGADVVIVSGQHTGGGTPLADLRAVRQALPDHPLWVGSGVRPETVGDLMGLADGAIVGTCLHAEDALTAPVEVERVRALVAAARAAVGRS